MIRKTLAMLIACALAVAAPAQASPGAMIFGNDAAASPDSVTLPTANDYFFTQNYGGTNQGTQVPSYWVNKVGAELDQLISSCTTLNMSTYTQVLGCIEQMIGSRGAEASFGPGTTSWTAPANVYRVKLREWGGGGGGGGSGLVNGSAAGGVGGAANSASAGVAGGNTSFNSSIVAQGGAAGTGSSSSSSPGVGGSAGGGGFGANGVYLSGIPIGQSGYGGNAASGSGSATSPSSFGNGTNGIGYGGGASGGANGGNGGAGAAGELILEW